MNILYTLKNRIFWLCDMCLELKLISYGQWFYEEHEPILLEDEIEESEMKLSKNDRIILKKAFIMLDYARKLDGLSTEGLTSTGRHKDEFVNSMYDKFSKLKSKLSFSYRRRDEIPLRYLASKV